MTAVGHRHTDFAAAFRGGVFLSRHFGFGTVERKELGVLALPTGRIVVHDPMIGPLGDLGPTPLRQRVAPGRYPVDLAVLRVDRDAWVACARVRFAFGEPTHWVPDATEDGDPLGYGVDTGTGCFVDASAPLWEDGEPDPGVATAIEERDLGVIVPLDTRPMTNVAAFSTGSGDGVYASYWGSAGHRRCALVTDFELLLDAVELRGVVPSPRLKPGPLPVPELEPFGVALTVEEASSSALTLRVRGDDDERLVFSPDWYNEDKLGARGRRVVYSFSIPSELEWRFSVGRAPAVPTHLAPEQVQGPALEQHVLLPLIARLEREARIVLRADFRSERLARALAAACSGMSAFSVKLHAALLAADDVEECFLSEHELFDCLAELTGRPATAR